MSEQNNSGAWLGLGLGIGIIIGGFFIYAILKFGQQPAQPAQMQTMQSPPPYLYQPPAINVYPVIKEQKPATGIHAPAIPSAPQAVPMEITAYKNNEHWEIERSKDGAIKGINIVRDVKADVAAAG